MLMSIDLLTTRFTPDSDAKPAAVTHGDAWRRMAAPAHDLLLARQP